MSALAQRSLAPKVSNCYLKFSPNTPAGSVLFRETGIYIKWYRMYVWAHGVSNKAFTIYKSSFSSPLSETITRLNGSFRRIVCTAKRDVRLICLVWKWMCSALIVLSWRCLEALVSVAVLATDSLLKQPASGISLLIYIFLWRPILCLSLHQCLQAHFMKSCWRKNRFSFIRRS